MSLKTVEQLRAARALLGMIQLDVAKMAGISEPTVTRLESGEGPIRGQGATIEKLQKAFESRGVRFIGDKEASLEGGPGVRLTKGEE